MVETAPAFLKACLVQFASQHLPGLGRGQPQDGFLIGWKKERVRKGGGQKIRQVIDKIKQLTDDSAPKLKHTLLFVFHAIAESSWALVTWCTINNQITALSHQDLAFFCHGKLQWYPTGANQNLTWDPAQVLSRPSLTSLKSPPSPLLLLSPLP